MKVYLETPEKVNKFVKAMINCSQEAELVSGRYVVDARSLMGIFSLDLSRPINLVFHGEISDKDYDSIKEFIVE